jgi:rod shape determining protein RodA
LIIRIINVAYQSRDNFSSLVCFGVAILLFFHTIVNVGMSLGIFPVMGIPLPFISQGGSSLLTNLLSVGIVMSINRNNMKQKLS